MAEPIDVILPILQRIQAELAEARRDLGGKVDTLAGKVDAIAERMDAFEDYFTYTMGLTQQNKADIARVSSEFKAFKASIEARPE